MGGYYNNYQDSNVYEPVFNLVYTVKNYYPTINKTSVFTKYFKNDDYSNLFIWNIETKEQTKVFSEEDVSTERIGILLFEEYYDEKEQNMVCSINNNYKQHIINNKRLIFRHPKNLLLIETHQEASEKKTLWTCNKLGQNLQKITSFPIGTEWHLDIGNSLIRVIKQQSKDVKIEEFPW